MPRIPDHYLDPTIYLYRSKHEAEEGINIGGTGFLIQVRTQRIPDHAFIYAVTNRHVIKSRAPVVRINMKGGGTDVFEFPVSHWECSKTDDLAVCVIPALQSKYSVNAVPFDMLLTKEDVITYNVGIGDSVFLVGRFINHEGRQRNLPSVRFGVISQMPHEPVQLKIGNDIYEQESFLADVRSIGGFSGSPVFLDMDELRPRPDRDKSLRSTKYHLLGVDWGHLRDWSPLCGPDGKPTGTGQQVELNTGMALIVPAWKLHDLMMSEEMKQRRARQEDDEIKRRSILGAVADVSESSPPATDENPTHREDFTSLANVAARKQKQDD